MIGPLEIKSPWRMVWMAYIDDFMELIRKSLPPDHNLQSHELSQEKYGAEKTVFIDDDDTAGEYLLMDSERTSQWKRSRCKDPTIIVLRIRKEVAVLVEKDNHTEILKLKDIDINGL